MNPPIAKSQSPTGKRIAGQRFKFTVERLSKFICLGDSIRIAYDETVKELGVRVQPSGHATFFLVKKVAGRCVRKHVGDAQLLKIEKARELAHDLLAETAAWNVKREGVNPMERKVENGETFGDLFESYVQHMPRAKRDGARPRKKSVEYRRMLYEVYLRPLHGRSVTQITTDSLQRLHRSLSDGKGEAIANRVLELCRATYNYGVRKRLFAGSNPCLGLDWNKEHSRDRFLQPAELVRFRDAIEKETNQDLVHFLMLLMATGARKSNVYAMQWEHISFRFATWSIPADDSKNDKPLQIELTPRAMSVLKARNPKETKTGWVFPSKSSKCGHIVDFKNQWRRVKKAAGLTDVTLHVLRRTFASYQLLAPGGKLPVVAATLGHASLDSTQVYARLLGSAKRDSMLAGEAAQEREMAKAEAELKKAGKLLAG